VCDLASPELYHSLDAIALFQETDGVVFLELVIVVVGVGPELQLFDLNDVLLFLGLMLLLLVFVLPLPMISTLPSGNTARTSRTRMASFTFSRTLGRRGG
jgi:hypothetical protein